MAILSAKGGYVQLSSDQKKLVARMADDLYSNTFAWDSTPDGFEYWETVREKLVSIANEPDEPELCDSCGQEVKSA